MPRLLPGSGESLPFPSLDALALHLLQQRPGRRLILKPVVVEHSDGPPFAAVSVMAFKPARIAEVVGRVQAVREGHDDPALAQSPILNPDEWLGLACDGVEREPLQAAVDRMRSAGGLAA